MLVLEGWIFCTGLCVSANSLRRSEGRGKLPERSCSGQCVIVIKVNVKEGDREIERALAPRQITQRLGHCECWWRDRALVEGTRGCTATLQALIDQGVWEALNSEASLNHANHKHTLTHPRIYPSAKSKTSIPEYTNEVTHNY